jgi:diacylglycerol kinase (ATP)
MQKIEKKDILFIINPHAGRKNIDFVVKKLRRIDKDIQYILANDLQTFEKELNKQISNHKVFVAVGGDGTVNALIKYLIDKEDKALAILPFGSGNGFSNEMGFKSNIELLIRQISKGEIINIDVLEINNNFFINLAGIGFDAAVAHKFQKSKERGFTSYIFSTAVAYFTYKSFKASITSNNFKIDGAYQMISIANTRQFGNNALISPTSRAFDGKFEIVLMERIPPKELFPFVYKLFKGTLKESKYIHYISSQDPVVIKTDCTKYHIDGDPFTGNGEYHIAINKNSLKVINTLSGIAVHPTKDKVDSKIRD